MDSKVKIPSNIYKQVVKVLYYHDQTKLCALFCSAKEPDLNWDKEDIEFYVCVLLELEMISQAYTLQHRFTERTGEGSLFQHFLELCRQNNMLNRLLQLSLDENEEV